MGRQTLRPFALRGRVLDKYDLYAQNNKHQSQAPVADGHCLACAQLLTQNAKLSLMMLRTDVNWSSFC